jgi:hypothetical protein
MAGLHTPGIPKVKQMLHFVIIWALASIITGPLIGHVIHFGSEDSGLNPSVG